MGEKVLRIIGFVSGYMFLLVGLFLCVDAFVPKSKSIMLQLVLGEFVVGVVIFIVSYRLIRYVRMADVADLPAHQKSERQTGAVSGQTDKRENTGGEGALK